MNSKAALIPWLKDWKINTTGAIGLTVVIIWGIVAIIGPYITPHSIGKIVDMDVLSPASAAFPLGSDYLGRDVLSRLLIGTRYTVGISLAGAILACTIGVSLGMITAAIGGWFDAIVSRTLDALNAIPSLMFALVIVAGVGSSIPVLIGTLTVLYAPGSYRFARALAVNINALDYVDVARARGEDTAYVIREEILPNIIGPVLADFGLRFVFIVLLLSGLSFLGLGVQPPNADWGALVKENISGLSFGAPAVIFPSLAIATLTISVNMLIDNLPWKIRDRQSDT